jgi:hypothetical protein
VIGEQDFTMHEGGKNALQKFTAHADAYSGRWNGSHREIPLTRSRMEAQERLLPGIPPKTRIAFTE